MKELQTQIQTRMNNVNETQLNIEFQLTTKSMINSASISVLQWNKLNKLIKLVMLKLNL